MRVNQCSLILTTLMASGSIDCKKAKKIGIKNLAARIYDLRKLGVVVTNTSSGYSLPYWAKQPHRKAESITQESLFNGEEI